MKTIVFVGHDDFQFLGYVRKRVAARKGELNRAGSFCSYPMTPLTKELTRWHKSGKKLTRLRIGGAAYCRLQGPNTAKYLSNETAEILWSLGCQSPLPAMAVYHHAAIFPPLAKG